MKKITSKINIIYSTPVAQTVFCAICASLFTYGLCYPIINEYVAGAFMAVFVVYECFRQKYVPMDLATLFLFQGLLICAIIDFHTNEQYMYWLHWAWVLPLGYLLGKVVALGQDSAKKILLAFGCLAAGMFCQGVLDFSYNYRLYGMFMTESWPQFWVTTEYQPRTTYELEFLLTTSSTFAALYYILKVNKKRVFPYLVLLAEILVQFVCFKTEGRTNMMHLVVVLLLGLIFYVYEKVSIEMALNNKNNVLRIILLSAAMTIIGALVGTLVYRANIGDIKITYMHSYLADGGGILKNIRFKAIAEAIMLLHHNPLGKFSGTILDGGSSHNMWLEYARQYGIVPFICLLLFSLTTMIYTLKLMFSKFGVKNKEKYKLVKYVLVPAFFCLNLYYSLEPNAHAHRNFWMFGIFISGMISSIVHPYKNNEEYDDFI